MAKREAAQASVDKDKPAKHEVIPHAYAIVPVPGAIGKYRAVHLTGVIAEKVEVLEPSGRAEPAAHGLARCESAMVQRTRKGGWK